MPDELPSQPHISAHGLLHWLNMYWEVDCMALNLQLDCQYGICLQMNWILHQTYSSPCLALAHTSPAVHGEAEEWLLNIYASEFGSSRGGG